MKKINEQYPSFFDNLNRHLSQTHFQHLSLEDKKGLKDMCDNLCDDPEITTLDLFIKAFRTKLYHEYNSKLTLNEFDTLTSLLHAQQRLSNPVKSIGGFECRTLGSLSKPQYSGQMRTFVERAFKDPYLRRYQRLFGLFLWEQFHSRLNEAFPQDNLLKEPHHAINVVLVVTSGDHFLLKDESTNVQFYGLQKDNNGGICQKDLQNIKDFQGVLKSNLNAYLKAHREDYFSESFLLHIDQLKTVSAKNTSKHKGVSAAADALVKTLEEGYEKLKAGSMTYEAYKANGLNAIKRCESLLDAQWDVGQILKNLAACILGLGVFYGAAVLTHKALTGRYLFFRPYAEVENLMDSLSNEMT